MADDVFRQMYEAYVIEESPSTTPKFPMSKTATSTSSIRLSTTESHDAFVKKKYNQRGGRERNEVDKYLIEDCEELLGGDVDNYFDLLGWWKINSIKYPVLSRMARDVLAAPVSTVASESAFSASGRILDPFRSSLSPKMVEALICTKSWLSSYKDPVVLREYMDEVEAFNDSKQVVTGKFLFYY